MIDPIAQTIGLLKLQTPQPCRQLAGRGDRSFRPEMPIGRIAGGAQGLVDGVIGIDGAAAGFAGPATSRARGKVIVRF